LDFMILEVFSNLWFYEGTTEKSLAPSSLLPPSRRLYTLIKISLNLLISRLSSPSPQPFPLWETFRSFSHLYGPSVDSTPILSMSLLYQGAQNWTQHSQVWPHQCWVDHLPQLAEHTLPHIVQEAADLLCHKGALLAHRQFGVHQYVFCKVAFQPVVPSTYCCMGLFLPSCRTWHVPLMNFEIPVCSFLQPVLFPLNGSKTIWSHSHPSEFCTTCKLLEGVFCSIA